MREKKIGEKKNYMQTKGINCEKYEIIGKIENEMSSSKMNSLSTDFCSFFLDDEFLNDDNFLNDESLLKLGYYNYEYFKDEEYLDGLFYSQIENIIRGCRI
ncbi:MAG: hypothetical protein KatS3mg002_1433 [Candidatus Woesearchaeota archaeon]|nr:MAG: hypothetical protein KatS3mg002_1433 [Candidatus Woesearchaeota archaeon]